jgi:arylsulfatase A-like enzyme
MKPIVLPLGLLCLLCSSATASARPNFVFVLFDDLPYAGMSALGNTRIETPNMDRLAKEGMFFSRAYSEVVCAPSRFTIFTGQYAARHGHTTVSGNQYPRARMREPDLVRNPIASGSFNLARLLKSTGYTTAIFGKWHMPGVPIRPRGAEAFGFDESVPVNHRAPYKDVVKNFELATDFVRRQDGGRPFFLYVPTFVTHGPQEVTREQTLAMAEQTGADRKLAEMLATISRTDACLGNLLTALDEKGFAGNTLFLMASDNGAYSLERHSKINKPFREGKGSLHEGGIRVPLVARWPGRIAPGTRSDSLVHFVDLLPTLAEVAGAKPPVDHILDGRSLVPLFEGGSWSGRTLFTHFPHYVMHWGTTPGHAVIQDRWKLIHYPFDHVTYPGERKIPETAKYAVGPRTELYDLQADAAERKNLAAQNPEVVAGLMKTLDMFLKDNHARMPTENPDYDPDRVLYNARDEWLQERDGSIHNEAKQPSKRGVE